jgi:hypothetical protein
MIGLPRVGYMGVGRDALKNVSMKIAVLGFVAAYGALMATQYAVPVLAASLGAVLLGISLANWRISYLILLAYLPYSGVASIILFPNTGAAALLKDVALVVPVYFGFIAYLARTKRPLNPTGTSTWYLALLAVVVLVQAFNPSLPDFLVPLVGIRVWLLYVPLVYVTAHFVRFEKRGLETILRVLVVSSLPVAALGLLQALLLTAGLDQLAYAAYGQAAAAITQDFAAFEIGTGTVRRVASTLPFAGQYFGFTLGAIATSYAFWRLPRLQRPPSRFALVALCVSILAALTSGSRGAFLLVPTLLLLTALFEGLRLNRFVGQGVLVVGALAAATASFGVSAADLLTHLAATAALETQFLVIDGLGRALPFSAIGLGTGADTSAARYVQDSGLLVVNTFGNVWFENWYLKALVELGIVGLVALALLIVGIVRLARFVLISGTQGSVPANGRVRGVAAPMAAFLLLVLLYNLKGAFVDLDPINVEFWVVLGMLLAWVPARGLRMERATVPSFAATAAGRPEWRDRHGAQARETAAVSGSARGRSSSASGTEDD